MNKRLAMLAYALFFTMHAQAQERTALKQEGVSFVTPPCMNHFVCQEPLLWCPSKFWSSADSNERSRAVAQWPITRAQFQIICEAADRKQPEYKSNIRHEYLCNAFIRYVCLLQVAAENLEVDVSSKNWIFALLRSKFAKSIPELDSAIRLRQQLTVDLDDSTMSLIDEHLQGIPMARMKLAPVGDFGDF